MTPRRNLAATVLVLAALACSSPRTGPEVNATLTRTMEAAELRIEQGDTFEAYHLLKAMSEVDDTYPGLRDRLNRIPPRLATLLARPALGSNVSVRQARESSWLTRILWYLPDRLADVLDLLSFDVHLGPGLYVDVHLTRAVQFSAGVRTVTGVGWHDQRSLGMQRQSQAGFSVPLYGAESTSAFVAGTSGHRGGTWTLSGFQRPSDALYQDERDYWAVGASATAVVAGAEAELHLAELLDLLAGVLAFDPLNDDLGRTTGPDLGEEEQRLLEQLYEMAGHAETLSAYARWRDSLASG